MKKNLSCLNVVLFVALFIVMQVNAENQSSTNAEIQKTINAEDTSSINKEIQKTINEEDQIPINTEIQKTIIEDDRSPLTEEESNYSLIDGIGRGFANLLLGWFDVPRGMVYYSVDYPVIGIIPGALEGAGMAFVRTLGGGLDLLTIGYLDPGNTVYDTMDAPLLPWEGAWLPVPEDEDWLLEFE